MANRKLLSETHVQITIENNETTPKQPSESKHRGSPLFIKNDSKISFELNKLVSNQNASISLIPSKLNIQ